MLAKLLVDLFVACMLLHDLLVATFCADVTELQSLFYADKFETLSKTAVIQRLLC